MKQPRPLTPRYRLGILARTVAALAGGYGLAALIAVASAWALPMAREEAATTGTMIALVALPVAAMGCFWAKSALRAWIGVALFAAFFAGIALLGGWRP